MHRFDAAQKANLKAPDVNEEELAVTQNQHVDRKPS